MLAKQGGFCLFSRGGRLRGVEWGGLVGPEERVGPSLMVVFFIFWSWVSLGTTLHFVELILMS